MNVHIAWKPNSKQQKAIDKEINNQIVSNVDALATNIEALMMWVLHTNYGFGKNRLLEFHSIFLPAIKDLQDYYAMRTSSETVWTCKHKLKEIGIDLDNM